MSRLKFNRVDHSSPAQTAGSSQVCKTLPNQCTTIGSFDTVRGFIKGVLTLIAPLMQHEARAQCDQML